MDVMYDVILGKLRMGDSNGGGGGSQYVKQMVYVTDSETTDATLNFGGGTHLEFTQPLQGLTFASVENSHDESEIVFTAGTAFPTGENPDPKLPVNASVIGEIGIEAGKKYLLNIRDAAFVCGEFTVVGSDLTRGVWYWDSAGDLDTSEIHGQTYLAGATISGGTLAVNPGAALGALEIEDYANAVIGGTVGSIIGESSSSVFVIGGTVQNVSSHNLDVTITGGIAVGIACHGAGKISVSEGAVTTILSTQTGDVDISGTALISGLTATNWDDLGFPGPRIAISGGTVDRLHMELIEASEDPMSLTISGGTVGLALVTQTGITNGTISATISESATVINLED